MKIYMTPIEVLAWFENGTPHPLRFKLDGKELKIDKVISMTEEKLDGNRMLIFRCQSEVAVVEDVEEESCPVLSSSKGCDIMAVITIHIMPDCPIR